MPAEGSVNRMSGHAAAAILTALIATTSLSAFAADAGAAPSAADVMDAISVANIEETIAYLQALGTREFHTSGAQQAAEYIYGQFEAIGLDVSYQSFELDAVTVRNVVATIQGTVPDEGIVLVGAHYDSENQAVDTYDEAITIMAPGADDDASGVAAVLEVARAISSSGTALTHTVKFVAFGAEEMGYNNMGGLAGSRYFVQQEASADVDYAGTAILDMIGYRDGAENVVSLIKDRDNDDLARAMVDAADEHGLDLRIDQYTAPEAKYADHASFWDAGYPSFLAIEEMEPIELMPLNPYYHTAGDTLSTLSLHQVEVVTQAVAGGVLGLASEDTGSGGVPIEVTVAAAAAGAGAIAVAAYYFGHRRTGR